MQSAIIMILWAYTLTPAHYDALPHVNWVVYARTWRSAECKLACFCFIANDFIIVIAIDGYSIGMLALLLRSMPELLSLGAL